MEIGDVYRIKWQSQQGIKHATGLYLGNFKENQLWLLCFFRQTDRDDPAGSFIMHGNLHDAELGYSFICRGNLIYGDYMEKEYQIGIVNESELSDTLIKIWESTESWKLQQTMRTNDPTGIKFWLNFTGQKGTVTGGFGRL